LHSPTITIISSTRARGIHIGARTHHHDHAMHFVSFSTIKAIVSKPKKPIPAPEELLFELIIFCF
jgi:hypothetical protein